MSHFEYVSVAVALVYALAVSRIVSAFPAILSAERRYWVHVVWALVILLAAVSTWWSIWNLRAVEWTALRFAWVLTVPALIYARASVLVSDDPAAVRSWRDHYFETRVRFFAIGMLIAANGAVLPWGMGFPWTVTTQVNAAILFVISALGLVSARAPLHAVLALCNLAMIVTSMVVQSLAA